MPANKRGGKREGAGRKALPPDLKLVKVTVRLSPDEAYWCRHMGKGNLSAGVRFMLNESFRKLQLDLEYESQDSPSK